MRTTIVKSRSTNRFWHNSSAYAFVMDVYNKLNINAKSGAAKLFDKPDRTTNPDYANCM